MQPSVKTKLQIQNRLLWRTGRHHLEKTDSMKASDSFIFGAPDQFVRHAFIEARPADSLSEVNCVVRPILSLHDQWALPLVVQEQLWAMIV